MKRLQKLIQNLTFSVDPDSNLEIVSLQTGHFIVRRVIDTRVQTSEHCLSVSEEQPTVTASCDSQQSQFRIDIVEQSNFKGLLTSQMSYKLRNSAGKCLTVRPGQSQLIFTDCTPGRGLFQVWSTCRHNQMCDVPFTWSARKITFPKNQTDVDNKISTPKQITQSGKLYSLNSIGIENELLYTIQNVVLLYEGDEAFVVDGITEFFPNESIQKGKAVAKAICEERVSQCAPCKTMAEEKTDLKVNETVALLMKWMAECNKPQANLGYKRFLSGDVLGVPTHLFPTLDPSSFASANEVDKFKFIRSNVRACLMNNIPTKVNDSGREAGIGTSSNNVPQTSLEYVYESKGNVSKQDYASIIDIRMLSQTSGQNLTSIETL